MSSKYFLVAENLTKAYSHETHATTVLRGISLTLNKGDSICIQGDSGAGKSTLLHILGTLDEPTTGNLFIKGKKIQFGNDSWMAQFRNETIGFVFQFHHLLNEFTVLENVMMPAWIAGEKSRQIQQKAKDSLLLLGLGHRLDHYPNQLSGGEKQRVSIARALMRDPEIILADEPTGNLDTENARLVQKILFEIQQRLNLCLIVVTHDVSYASLFEKRYTMKDGLWV